MNRRRFLQSLIAASVITPGSALASLSESTATGGKRYPWKNWSGNLSCFPKSIAVPKEIEALKELLAVDPLKKVRMVGAGHSFSPLAVTDEIMLSMRHFSGVTRILPESNQAVIGAGTTLNKIGPALAEAGQALINMPDIDHQTLAGAISTATHGTGRELNCLSHYIDEIELIDPAGEAISCNQNSNPELFRCAQVGMGMFGVITSITMRNRPAFRLRRESFWSPLDDTLTSIDMLSKTNRNIEFYYFPFTGMTYIDTLNETSEPISEGKEIDGNSGLMDLKMARDYLESFPAIRELILKTYMKTIEMEVNIDHSYSIYASERNVRFNEMEYHLPIENGTKALREIITTIETQFPEVFFPIECRYIKADDCWLSPFYQRDTFSIAVHRYFEEDYKPLFDAVEPIFKKYAGRPHWGKMNNLTRQEALDLYPKMQEAIELRKEFDPKGRFLNPYLERMFA